MWGGISGESQVDQKDTKNTTRTLSFPEVCHQLGITGDDLQRKLEMYEEMGWVTIKRPKEEPNDACKAKLAAMKLPLISLATFSLTGDQWGLGGVSVMKRLN